MKTRLDKKISLVLMIIIITLMIVDIIATITSPMWLKVAFEKGYVAIIPVKNTVYQHAYPSSNYPFMLVFIIYCGLAALFALWQAAGLMRNILADNPFCMKNAVYLFRAAIGGIFLAIAFFVKMFVAPSAITLLCLAVFIFYSMIMFVLADLFKKAAMIKEENELTI